MHAQWLEHQFLHQCREGFACRVGHGQLHDGGAATRIPAEVDPGVSTTLTASVLAGLLPSRICGTVGS